MSSSRKFISEIGLGFVSSDETLRCQCTTKCEWQELWISLLMWRGVPVSIKWLSYIIQRSLCLLCRKHGKVERKWEEAFAWCFNRWGQRTRQAYWEGAVVAASRSLDVRHLSEWKQKVQSQEHKWYRGYCKNLKKIKSYMI